METMLSSVETCLKCINTCQNCGQVYSHLTINPNHLGLLGELPSNLKILLLQHTPDRSTLYGAFYESNRLTDSQKSKTTPASGTLACTRVTKVTVDPRALLKLRDRAQTFGRETKRTFLKEARWCGNEGMSGTGSQHQMYPTSNTEEKLVSHFKAIVQEMEEYLHPVLCQFDFSSLRNQTSIAENTQPKEREEKAIPDKGPAVGAPAECGDCVVLLADWMLLQLPLEALDILQQDGLSSVSRDFSLQVLHTRLQREESVESDNKKETIGGKGSKGKVDQSKDIKVVPVNRVLPHNTLPINTHNFRYIIDPYNEEEYDGNSLSEWMKRTLEAYSGQFTPFWDGVMGSEHTPSLSDFEQLLKNCGAFIFHGTERFLANIPPSKIVALNLSECQMVILFDMVQNSASMLRQTKLDMQKSSEQLDLERPLETALLLTLSGVHCVLLNQWHSSSRRNTLNMDSVLNNLLRAGLTSGQTVHALRKEKIQNTQRDANTARSNDPAFDADSGHIYTNANDAQPMVTPSLSAFNCVIYGLPNLVVT